MPADYRNSLGWLALQIRQGQAQHDQMRIDKTNDQNREANMAQEQNAVALTREHLGAVDRAEDRKLTLAGMLQKAADDRQAKADLEKSKQEAGAPLTEAKVNDLISKGVRREAQTKDDEHDNNFQDTHETKVVVPTFQLKQDEFKYQQDHDKVKDTIADYNARTNRAGIPYKGPYGGTGVGEHLSPEGLPTMEDGTVAGGPGPLNLGSLFRAPPAASGTPNASASPPVTSRAPDRVEDAPALPEAVKKAQAALGKSREVVRMHDEAIKNLNAVPDKDYGIKAEGGTIPDIIPWLGGKHIPGTNWLQDVKVGLKGGTAQDKADVETRALADSSVQKLAQNIALELLGTTSTASQESRVQRIIGLTQGKTFATDKKVQLDVLAQSRKLARQIQAENAYIIKHHRVPLGELPDVGDDDVAPEATASAPSAETSTQAAPKSDAEKLNEVKRLIDHGMDPEAAIAQVRGD